MTGIGELLASARIDAREARLLLSRASGLPEAIIAAFPERTVGETEGARFHATCARRRGGEPIAYILGEREFYGLRFQVNPAVLIPRPETELLVEQVIEAARSFMRPRIADLGTGSGAIAIAVARSLPAARVTATDASSAALAVARTNAAALGTPDVEFVLSDWFAGLGDREYDVIASNPPYVADRDCHLSRGDLRFEPADALAGGADGLDCLRHIAASARARLAAGGTLLLEHGHDQGAAVRRLLNPGFTCVRTWHDLAGHERVTGGRTDAPAKPVTPSNSATTS